MKTHAALSQNQNRISKLERAQEELEVPELRDLTVLELEQLLFAAYPAADAQVDDRLGLLVGDPASPVRSIALALDATVDSIEVAAASGCNVLVTHHPAFWIPPTLFLREAGTSSYNGLVQAAATAIYRAAEKGMALISMHTNHDSAPSANEMLLAPVGYEYRATILPAQQQARGTLPDVASVAPSAPTPPPAPTAPASPSSTQAFKAIPGLGQLGVPRNAAPPATLEELAQRYKEEFGAVAKVWGDPAMPVEVLATCSGGGGELVPQVIASDANCYVTGELRYHEVLELAGAGVALIELGHDRSELPYRLYLRDTLLAAGIASERIHIVEPLVSWWQPTEPEHDEGTPQ